MKYFMALFLFTACATTPTGRELKLAECLQTNQELYEHCSQIILYVDEIEKQHAIDMFTNCGKF